MSATLKEKSITFRPRGLSDAIDGSNSFPGAMSSLQNLIPAPSTQSVFVPRPASVTMATSAAAAAGSALITVGDIAYGMVGETSGPYSGKDVPFAYNMATSTFLTIAIPGGAASLPTTQANTGDWTPPRMAQIGTRIIICHPGYPGSGGIFFGWLGVSSFSSATITGTTHSNKTLDTLSTNVLLAGWTVGMKITSSAADIPANTTIAAIASGGLSVTLSANATGSNAGDTLTVTDGTAAAPLYGSGNTNGTALSVIPLDVCQFNGRAYYAVGNAVVFSDSGNPLQVTNATQALTFQNGLNVTALGGTGLTSQVTGGIIQSLICFQGQAQMWQITGDSATSNLVLNELNVSTGTLAPNTICGTPFGLAFIAPDGLRLVTPAGQIGDPIGIYGSGVSLPFLLALYPTRMCAAFDNNVVRISVLTQGAVAVIASEYWYDFNLKVWTGPHSFPAALIAPWHGLKSTFVMFAYQIDAILWESDAMPNASSLYVENGNAITCAFQTTLLPDNDNQTMNTIIEMTVAAMLPYNTNAQVTAQDELGQPIDYVNIQGRVQAGVSWGAFNWGAALWGQAVGVFYQHPVNWTKPIVFKQCQITVSFVAAPVQAIGNLRMGWQPSEYNSQRTN